MARQPDNSPFERVLDWYHKRALSPIEVYCRAAHPFSGTNESRINLIFRSTPDPHMASPHLAEYTATLFSGDPSDSPLAKLIDEQTRAEGLLYPDLFLQQLFQDFTSFSELARARAGKISLIIAPNSLFELAARYGATDFLGKAKSDSLLEPHALVAFWNACPSETKKRIVANSRTSGGADGGTIPALQYDSDGGRQYCFPACNELVVRDADLLLPEFTIERTLLPLFPKDSRSLDLEADDFGVLYLRGDRFELAELRERRFAHFLWDKQFNHKRSSFKGADIDEHLKFGIARPRDYFQHGKHPAWGKVIVEEQQGFYRLHEDTWLLFPA